MEEKICYCGRGMFPALGHCGSIHHVCIPCDREYCTLYNEDEHLSDNLEGRINELLRQSQKPAPSPKKTRTRNRGTAFPRALLRPKTPKNSKEKLYQLYNQIIMKAEGYLGDMMAEYAAGNYEDQGGIEGMIAGSFSLTKAEIKDCMFEALGITRFDLDKLRIDRVKLVNYWYNQDY